jgi:hypothetical protein
MITDIILRVVSWLHERLCPCTVTFGEDED